MNILVILSDQHHARFMGNAGHPVVETPHLDRLAREGVRFDAAYCPSPLCGPSRMSFLTGLYPCHSGVYANGQALASDLPTFAHALGGAGYDTALIGRMHLVGPDPHHGFEEKWGQDVTPSTLGGGILPLLEGLAAGGGPEGLQLSGPGDSAYQHYDDRITDLACDWLARRPPDRPFCLTVGLALPHNPFVCSPDDYQRYIDRVPQPLPRDRRGGGSHPLERRKRDAIQWDRVTAEDEWRTLIAYHGSVTATDRRVGRILEELDRQGLTDDTLLIYTSDHGEAAGERGLWYKTTMYEGSAAIPLILRCPRHIPGGQTRSECVNLIDVTATLLETAGLPPLPAGDGRSLWGLATGVNPDWKNETFAEYGTRWGCSELSRMIRRGSWKYVYYDGYPDELFDLSSDPRETRNLAEAPECQGIRRDLRNRLMTDWDPVRINRDLDLWNERNRLIYRWYAARDRPDPELYAGPPGCNRLDRVPHFKPRPVIQRGMY